MVRSPSRPIRRVGTLLSTSFAEGVPVNVISRQLGHANSSVTARYLDHVAPAAVIETMQRRNWHEPDVPAK
jgi:integrase